VQAALDAPFRAVLCRAVRISRACQPVEPPQGGDSGSAASRAGVHGLGPVRAIVSGFPVLVTGAAARSAASSHVAAARAVPPHAPGNARRIFDILNELQGDASCAPNTPIICGRTNLPRIQRVPGVTSPPVFHAAAHKLVPLMERRRRRGDETSPWTENIVRCAAECDTQHSSDFDRQAVRRPASWAPPSACPK